MMKETGNRIRNKKLALTGAFSALIILMGIPGLHLGYIQISPTVSLTISHIPVILAAFFAGFSGSVITGLVFGLTSLINAAANPSGVLDPLFMNPLCSVLPRLLFSVFAWALIKCFNLIPKLPQSVSAPFIAFISSFFHTAAVLGAMYIFLGAQISSIMEGLAFFAAIASILPGVMMEAVAAALVSGVIMGAVSVSSKTKKSKISKIKDNISDN